MTILVNGRPVPKELIQEEEARIGRDPNWQAVVDLTERAARIREAAEYAAVNRTLLERMAEDNPSPVDPALIEREVEGLKGINRCREAFNDSLVRQHVERHLRINQTIKELTASAIKPTIADVQAFYNTNRANFGALPRFEASHIVKHVNETQTEEQALAGIHDAFLAACRLDNA